MLRIILALMLGLAVASCGEETDGSDDASTSESGAADEGSVGSGTESPDLSAGEVQGEHTVKRGVNDSLAFPANNFSLSFERGSSRCCGPVRIGETITGLNLRISFEENDLPSGNPDSDLYLLWLQYFGTPEQGKTYPVKWMEQGANDPNFVYVRAISQVDSTQHWGEQGVTIEGQVAFYQLDSITPDTENGALEVQWDLNFSEGTLSGSVAGPAFDLIAECNKECDAADATP